MTRAEAIVAEVAARHIVSVADMTGPSRRTYLVDARADAAQRMAAETDMRLHQIAEALGRQDHSTVHNMLKRTVAR